MRCVFSLHDYVHAYQMTGSYHQHHETLLKLTPQIVVHLKSLDLLGQFREFVSDSQSEFLKLKPFAWNSCFSPRILNVLFHRPSPVSLPLGLLWPVFILRIATSQLLEGLRVGEPHKPQTCKISFLMYLECKKQCFPEYSRAKTTVHWTVKSKHSP